MPDVAKTLIDVVLRRVRDPQGSAHSRDLVRSLLSHSQRMLNAVLGSATETVTLNTEAQRKFYPISALVPTSARVLAVREGGRDLREIGWLGFAQADRYWTRRLGSRFLEFSTIGRDLLVIHPAKDEASSVSVIAASLTTELSSEDTEVEVPVDDVPAVLSLAEAVLSLRDRNIGGATGAMARVVEHVRTRRA